MQAPTPRESIRSERSGRLGIVTLDRPRRCNALDVEMAQDLRAAALSFARDEGASDLHISPGLPPIVRLRGVMTRLEMAPLSPEDTHAAIYDVLNDAQKNRTEYVFKNVRENVGVPEDRFRFAIPSGVEVVVSPERAP